MSPYIVTTKRTDGPVVAFAADGAPVTAANRRIEAGEPWPHQAVSRRAVATLEEARVEARVAVPLEQYAGHVLRAIDALPESGGTISLPDGTSVEVEAIPREKLSDLSDPRGMDPAWSEAQKNQWVIDAFNAREAIR